MGEKSKRFEEHSFHSLRFLDDCTLPQLRAVLGGWRESKPTAAVQRGVTQAGALFIGSHGGGGC